MVEIWIIFRRTAKKRDPDENPVPFKIQYPMKNHNEDNVKIEVSEGFVLIF